MTITLLEKAGENEYKVINQLNEKTKRSDFISSIDEDNRNGVEHQFEVVTEKPVDFTINKIYILADGSRVWVWVEQDAD